MKRLLCLLLLLISLAGCSSRPPAGTDGSLHVLATTYPVYLFTTAVTEGARGVEVALLVNSQTSCLHDYTLTVGDMKAIESADVIVQNGGGLEDFMDAALVHSDAEVIDCSAGLSLFPSSEHGGGEEYDPHFWMDPDRAAEMLENITAGLCGRDKANETLYRENAAAAQLALEPLRATAAASRDDEGAARLAEQAARQEIGWTPYLFSYDPKLITFHDGFQYFASAFRLELVKAIEEEEGSTASAQELREVVSLMEDYEIPAIFVEKNGSTASAEVIARETGCKVYALDMLMSGDGAGLQPYLDAMYANLQTVLEAFQ